MSINWWMDTQKCVISIKWNANKKEWSPDIYSNIDEHSKTNLSGKVNCRSHIVWFHLSRIGKYRKTENVLVFA